MVAAACVCCCQLPLTDAAAALAARGIKLGRVSELAAAAAGAGTAQGSSNSGGSGADALSGVSPSQPGSTGTATPQGSSQVGPVHATAGSGAMAGGAAASAGPAGAESVVPAGLLSPAHAPPSSTAVVGIRPSTPQTVGPVSIESPQRPGIVAASRARLRHDAAREAAAAAVLRRFVQKLSGRDPDLRRPLLTLAGPPDPPEVTPAAYVQPCNVYPLSSSKRSLCRRK